MNLEDRLTKVFGNDEDKKNCIRILHKENVYPTLSTYRGFYKGGSPGTNEKLSIIKEFMKHFPVYLVANSGRWKGSIARLEIDIDDIKNFNHHSNDKKYFKLIYDDSPKYNKIYQINSLGVYFQGCGRWYVSFYESGTKRCFVNTKQEKKTINSFKDMFKKDVKVGDLILGAQTRDSGMRLSKVIRFSEAGNATVRSIPIYPDEIETDFTLYQERFQYVFRVDDYADLKKQLLLKRISK